MRSRRAYHAFVAAGLPQGRRPDLQGGSLLRSLGVWRAVTQLRRGREAYLGDERILGRSAFVETIRQTLRAAEPTARDQHAVADLVAAVCAASRCHGTALQEGSRRAAVARAREGIAYLALEINFSMRDCAGCPRQADCLTRGERTGRAQPRRRVYLSDMRQRKIIEGAAGTAWRKGHLRVRGYIEPKFDEQMNHHGLRHARDWGLAKVTLQVLLNAITVNAKRAVKLLARAAGQPGLRPTEVSP